MESHLPQSKQVLLSILICLISSLTLHSQINLGNASNFCLFTGVGAVSNTGTSHITGNVGTNGGAISGFSSPTTVAGSIVAPGSTSETAKDDLIIACAQIRAELASTIAHTPLFGSETIYPGVHFATAASSLNGTLTLDAQGQADATFVFKIGGAFNTAVNSTIILNNGAKASNVFFLVTGEIVIAAGSNMKGTWIANDGAISMAAGSTIEGRLLSVTGDVSVNNSTASIPVGMLLSNGQLSSFTAGSGPVSTTLKWLTVVNPEFSRFTIERAGSDQAFYAIAVVDAHSNRGNISYEWLDLKPLTGLSYYRLKATSIDNVVHYSAVLKVTNIVPQSYIIYPNPVQNGRISISFKSKAAGIY